MYTTYGINNANNHQDFQKFVLYYKLTTVIESYNLNQL